MNGGGLRGSLCSESSKISCVVRGFGMVGWSCDGGGEDTRAEGEDILRGGGGEEEEEEQQHCRRRRRRRPVCSTLLLILPKKIDERI